VTRHFSSKIGLERRQILGRRKNEPRRVFCAFFSCVRVANSYVCPCPNRTCLWSCVGWRESGQEAGESPEKQTGSRRRTGELRLHGGSRLKATTDRAFSSLLALQRPAYRRGLSFLPGVRIGISLSNRRPLTDLDYAFASSGLMASTAQHPIVCMASSCWAMLNGRRTALFPSRVASPSRERERLTLVHSEARYGVGKSPRPSRGCRDDRSYPEFPARPP
jgi:hypothetical protein